MNLAIFGNIVTSFSWFGVNMLGIGLHSYGFMDAAFKWLMIFIGSQVLVIALGLLPLQPVAQLPHGRQDPAPSFARPRQRNVGQASRLRRPQAGLSTLQSERSRPQPQHDRPRNWRWAPNCNNRHLLGQTCRWESRTGFHHSAPGLRGTSYPGRARRTEGMQPFQPRRRAAARGYAGAVESEQGPAVGGPHLAVGAPKT